jgi:rhodanese-related sulfurtransferase
MKKSYEDLIRQAKARITEVTAAEVIARQQAGDKITLIDTREDHEVNLGTIPGSVHVSRGNLEKLIEQVAPREEPIVLFCSGGTRSTLAAATLEDMGYENVASMAGGLREWVAQGGDVE